MYHLRPLRLETIQEKQYQMLQSLQTEAPLEKALARFAVSNLTQFPRRLRK
jgi:hypothetical protein